MLRLLDLLPRECAKRAGEAPAITSGANEAVAYGRWRLWRRASISAWTATNPSSERRARFSAVVASAREAATKASADHAKGSRRRSDTAGLEATEGGQQIATPAR